MSNVIGLSDYHEANLRTLAEYLLSGNLKAEFDMGRYTDITNGGQLEAATKCGSVGCAIGHAPSIGIHKSTNETWGSFSIRVFGLEDGNYWGFCFNTDWVDYDNTPQGAAKRILYLLDYGVPSDFISKELDKDFRFMDARDIVNEKYNNQ